MIPELLLHYEVHVQTGYQMQEQDHLKEQFHQLDRPFEILGHIHGPEHLGQAQQSCQFENAHQLHGLIAVWRHKEEENEVQGES